MDDGHFSTSDATATTAWDIGDTGAVEELRSRDAGELILRSGSDLGNDAALRSLSAHIHKKNADVTILLSMR